MCRESVLTASDILSVLKNNSVGCVKHSVKIHENEDEKCFQIIMSNPRSAWFKVVKSRRCRQKKNTYAHAICRIFFSAVKIEISPEKKIDMFS